MFLALSKLSGVDGGQNRPGVVGYFSYVLRDFQRLVLVLLFGVRFFWLDKCLPDVYERNLIG
jgi:hypothetical protein